MRPTQLHAAGMVAEIHRQPVTTENAAENRSQQRHQHCGTPRGGHRIENELLGHECPDPALVAVAAPTRLVHVPHCFARQLLLPLLTGLLDRLADFLPSFLSAPQTDFQAQQDRKSTRLNSSHGYISYAVFCLKKKNS